MKDTDREAETVCHIDPLFLLLTIPRCVIFKDPLSISTQPEACCGVLNRRLAVDHSMTTIWDWLKTHTACISRGHLSIKFHNTRTFPLNHVTASAYFRSCVLCRESLIDSSVKGQHSTRKSIFRIENIDSSKLEFFSVWFYLLESSAIW